MVIIPALCIFAFVFVKAFFYFLLLLSRNCAAWFLSRLRSSIVNSQLS